MSAVKSPAWIQLATRSTTGVWSPARKGRRREHATIVARPTEPTPTTLTNRLPSFVPRSPLTRKPASGSAGTSQSGRGELISPLEQVNLVHVDRLRVAEQGHEDREADRRLRRGDRDHEEDRGLSFQGAGRGAVTEKSQVRRVHHDFDREKDGDGGAAQESPREPDGEQGGRSEKDVGQRNRSDHDCFSRETRTKAPTRAASSSTERASKGSRYSEYT